MKQPVCVLGDGAWGTAIAVLLANNGHSVNLWCNDESVAHAIAHHGCNDRYLSGITLPNRITPTTDIAQAMQGARWIFEAVPVKFLRATVEKAKPHVTADQAWVVLSKGIENGTLMFPSQIIDAVLGYTATQAVFSGPSFARDLAHKKITAATIAATDYHVSSELTALLANSYFRPYISYDMLGAQLGGALKNVVALAIGMLDGAGYTDNTKTFMLTRGLQEMIMLTRALGGQHQTLYGLSGLGDLVLTCMGSLSKNLAVGKQLGAGCTLDQLIAQSGAMPEGVNTVVSVNQLALKLNVNLPLFQGVYRIIFESSSLETMLNDLMSQPLEHECSL